MLRYKGSQHLRQRLVCSTLSGKAIRIDDIRLHDESPGLRDFEASLLRLLEKVTNGCVVEINETGTSCCRATPAGLCFDWACFAAGRGVIAGLPVSLLPPPRHHPEVQAGLGDWREGSGPRLWHQPSYWLLSGTVGLHITLWEEGRSYTVTRSPAANLQGRQRRRQRQGPGLKHILDTFLAWRSHWASRCGASPTTTLTLVSTCGALSRSPSCDSSLAQRMISG
jgi:RNA 3'-terminal phosphate cyclase